jgi:hypothetical protein
MESSSEMKSELNRGLSARESAAAAGSVSGLAEAAQPRRSHGITALACTIRDTVYAMFDALRGRYDC